MAVDHNRQLIEVVTTDVFSVWQSKLKDLRAVQRIDVAIVRLRNGLGVVKRLSPAVSEVKIDHGPGYRLHFTRRGDRLIILLCGGDKQSQQKDVKRAELMAAELE